MLSDFELVKKNERGKIDFKGVVKSTIIKKTETQVFKSKTPAHKNTDENQKTEN
jgi:hypothetical protein